MVQFASYLRSVLCKTRLIFPRINGPNENRECADNQCPKSGAENTGEFVARKTEKCPLSVLTGVRNKPVNSKENL